MPTSVMERPTSAVQDIKPDVKQDPSVITRKSQLRMGMVCELSTIHGTPVIIGRFTINDAPRVLDSTGIWAVSVTPENSTPRLEPLYNLGVRAQALSPKAAYRATCTTLRVA